MPICLRLLKSAFLIAMVGNTGFSSRASAGCVVVPKAAEGSVLLCGVRAEAVGGILVRLVRCMCFCATRPRVVLWC